MCRSINFNLYSIGKMRKYLDRRTVDKLLDATITSRLDYCNRLMLDLTNELITQLQMPQNHAAPVTIQWRKYDHITAVFVNLRWIPVNGGLVLISFCLLTRPWMSSHLHTYANSSFRTPQGALCDPGKTINWHPYDVEWRTLAKGLLLQLHQCCRTTFH